MTGSSSAPQKVQLFKCKPPLPQDKPQEPPLVQISQPKIEEIKVTLKPTKLSPPNKKPVVKEQPKTSK